MKPAENAPHPAARLTQSVKVSNLCAFYGGLLTQRQRSALQLHFDEDWSLAEVAQHLDVSRQSVHDLITRSVQKLNRYEEALGCAAQSQRMGEGLQDTVRELEAALALSPGPAQEPIRQALAKLRKITQELEGEE